MLRRLCSSRDAAVRLVNSHPWCEERGVRYMEQWLDRTQARGGVVLGNDEQLGVFVPMLIPVHHLEKFWRWVHPTGKHLYCPLFSSEAGEIDRSAYARYLQLEFPKTRSLYFGRDKYDEVREVGLPWAQQ